MVIRHRIIKLIILALMAFVIMPAVTSFAGTISYEYDELNRLKTETYPDGTVIKYEYDKLGNRKDRIVTFPTVTIQASAGPGGSITPSGDVIVRKNTNQAFNITADTGYHISNVTVDGGTLTNLTYDNNFTTHPYTFVSAVADHTIAAEFAINAYTVSAVAGSNGSLDATTPSPVIVNFNNTASFKFNAITGYHVAGVSGCGMSYNNTSNAINSYTATTGEVTADCTVNATFSINQYNVSAIAGLNGSLDSTTPSPQLVNHNGTTSFKFNAAVPGYHIASISGCGISYSNTINDMSSHTVITQPIVEDCIVSAIFAINTYPLSIALQTTPITGVGGKVVSAPIIDCPGTCTNMYEHGTSVTLTATANTEYRLTGWTGDCTPNPDTTCTALMTSAKYVTANFIQTFKIAVTVTAHGTVSADGVTISGTTQDIVVDYDGSKTFTMNTIDGSVIYKIIVDAADISVNNPSGPMIYPFVNVRQPHSLSVTFICPDPLEDAVIAGETYRLKNPGDPLQNTHILQDVYDRAGNNATILTQSGAVFSQNINFNKNMNITMDGGYSCRYNAKEAAPSRVQGQLTISDGTATISDFEILQ